jgi:hypothetical protein
MFVGDGLIVVVYEQSVIPSLLIAAVWKSLEVLLKSGNNLLKSLLVNASCGAPGIEMHFIDTFGKQTGETPSTNTLRYVKYESPSLVEREVYVVLRLEKVFLGLLVQFVIRFGLKSEKFFSSCALNFRAPLIEGQCVKTRNPSLLRILP